PGEGSAGPALRRQIDRPARGDTAKSPRRADGPPGDAARSGGHVGDRLHAGVRGAFVTYVSCDLCGADQTELLFPADRKCGPIVRCRACGLVYQNPRDELAVDWSDEYTREEDEFYLRQYLRERGAKRRGADTSLDVL